ncbi:MAG: hypothetical protein K6E47_06075 [Lachnospiraceae bacterium]|nr:hypothetical protein [Lachnospiraceae bacterium]
MVADKTDLNKKNKNSIDKDEGLQLLMFLDEKYSKEKAASLVQIYADNQEYSVQLKKLEKSSKALYGKTLAAYLRDLNIIGRRKSTSQKVKAEDAKRYEQAYALWEISCSVIDAERENELQKRFEEKKNEMERDIISKRNKIVKAANDKITENSIKKKVAEATLSTLFFFRFRAKREQRAIMEASEAAISEAKQVIKNAEAAYEAEMAEVSARLSVIRSQIKIIVASGMPYPPEPVAAEE